MGVNTWQVAMTDADLSAASTAHYAGVPWVDLAARYGADADTIRKRVRRWRARQGSEEREDADTDVAPPTPTALPDGAASPVVEQQLAADGGVTLRVKDLPRVRTVDEVIAAGGLEPAHWTVIHAELKAYEGFMKSGAGDPVVVPLTSAHVKLAPNVSARAALAAMDALIERMTTRAPIYPAVRQFTPADDDLMLEVNISDAHVGMLAWGPETGEDYDSSIAAADWRSAVADIVALAAQWKVSRILLPTGNDLFHSDVTVMGKGGATTAGTPQDVDTRWPKMLETGTELVVDTIDQLRVIAPVDVRMVMGNHSGRSEFQLGQIVKAWYRNDNRVDVVNPYSACSHYVWGDTLIGFTHGHGLSHGDLPLAMAAMWPEAWARTRWREWHLGHHHAAKATTHKAKTPDYSEDQGVRVVIVPGLTASDAWHAGKLLRHQRCAEARLWSKTRGPVGMFNVWLKPREERAA